MAVVKYSDFLPDNQPRPPILGTSLSESLKWLPLPHRKLPHKFGSHNIAGFWFPAVQPQTLCFIPLDLFTVYQLPLGP